MKNQNIAVREISIVSRSNFMGQEVDVYGTAEEPLFLAKDVAKWIEHSDVSMMLRNVDDDEKEYHTNPNNVLRCYHIQMQLHS